MTKEKQRYITIIARHAKNSPLSEFVVSSGLIGFALILLENLV